MKNRTKVSFSTKTTQKHLYIVWIYEKSHFQANLEEKIFSLDFLTKNHKGGPRWKKSKIFKVSKFHEKHFSSGSHSPKTRFWCLKNLETTLKNEFWPIFVYHEFLTCRPYFGHFFLWTSQNRLVEVSKSSHFSWGITFLKTPWCVDS